MKNIKSYCKYLAITISCFSLFATFQVAASEDHEHNRKVCRALPSHDALSQALFSVVNSGGNGGLGNDMWATVVNRDGVVCAVTFSGDKRGDQWPGSRVISAQKGNTANAFSLPGMSMGFAAPLSSGNLYGTVLEQGSLLGLQFSNPVNPKVAYAGPAKRYGQRNDPMVGKKPGGVNVFGGGLALYNADGRLIGGLGVSGDTSCSDHYIARRVRYELNLDNIPGGVASGTDNLIIATPVAPNSFEHPTCLGLPDIAGLPTDFPIGP